MKPLHYQNKNNEFDVIDFIDQYELNFNLGNVVKYVARCQKKNNKKGDLLKAIDYLNREIETIDKQTKQFIEENAI